MQSSNTITAETFRITPKYINLYQAIFESYEGLGILRTIDSSQGLIEIMYNSAQRNIVMEVMQSITNDLF